jgi:hypothetical protein
VTVFVFLTQLAGFRDNSGVKHGNRGDSKSVRKRVKVTCEPFGTRASSPTGLMHMGLPPSPVHIHIYKYAFRPPTAPGLAPPCPPRPTDGGPHRPAPLVGERPFPTLHRCPGLPAQEIRPTPVSSLAARPPSGRSPHFRLFFSLGRGDAECNRFPRWPVLRQVARRPASRACWAPGCRRPAPAGGPDLAGGASRRGEAAQFSRAHLFRFRSKAGCCFFLFLSVIVIFSLFTHRFQSLCKP